MSLVAHWPLNETGVTSIRDHYGTNDGTWAGTDLITNGDFGTGDLTGWTQSAAPDNKWTVAANKASIDGTQTGSSNLISAGTVVAGKTYTIVYTYTRAAGTITAILGGTSGSTNSGAGATITETITAAGTTIVLQASSAFVGTLDDVSVREHADQSSRPGAMAILFDGADDKITVGADPTIDANGKTALSISAWINPASDGEGDFGRIVSKADSIAALTAGYYFLVTGEAASKVVLRTLVVTDGANMLAVTGAVAPLNTWSHVAAVYNEDGLQKGKIYLNGVLQTNDGADNAGGDTISDDSAVDLTIGNATEATTRTFDGSISDVRIYDHALSNVEVKDLYEITGKLARHRSFPHNRYFK